MEDLVLESGLKKGVTFTSGATAEIKRLIQADPINETQALRIGVKGGGCAGFSYILEFDTIKPTDTIYELDGFKVAIDPTHEMYLGGTEVDFQMGLNNRGFIYNNPNASKTCGCGESFG
jgi:iron-sulfur cluster assembly protein